MDDQRDWVRIERVFNAPIETIWDLWTQPDLFKLWYGPKGMSVPTAEMDVRIGGTRRICMAMSSPERSMTMWFTGVYKEIDPPHRLVYTESLCDAEGNIIPPQSMGMPDDFPDITEIVVELSEADGATRMVMVHVGVSEGTAGAGGWRQAFDKMSDIIAAMGEREA